MFAPGHLGALTRYLPFELVDDVLDQPGRRGRTRTVPARVAVYFVLALALFPGGSYGRVWDTLAGALRQAGHLVASVTAAGLACVRRRVGPDPLRELFEVVAGPLGRPCTRGVSWRGLRTVAFDGCRSTRVPETGDNVAWLGRYKVAAGVAAYPLLAVMALAETGTRALLGAVVGPYRGEVEAALQLVGHLRQDMVVLADRGFDANAFIRAVHASRAALLLRICSSRRPAVLQVLADGSFLSVIAGVPVRVIAATVTVTCADGSTHRGEYRLVTTLTDARRHPAEDLLALYHQRWEIEVTFLAIRHTMLKGRVLRSGDPQGLRQEMWALLTVHQLLRMAMLDATDAVPGCDPDRACFTAALVAARDSVTRGAAIVPDAGSELTGPIAEAVIGALLPPRRPRISARTVKGVSARYGHRRSDEDRPCVSTPVTALDIIVHFPQQDTPVPAPTAAQPGRPGRNPALQQDPPVTAQTLLPPAVPMHTSRLEDVLAAMGTAPEREWRAIELATLLRLDRGDLTGELIRWSRRQILIKTGPATFKIPDGPPQPSKLAVHPEDVLAVMATDPHRPWHAREITAALNTVKHSTLAQHLSAWARKNLLVKTAPATYRLPEQSVPAAPARPLAATNTPTRRAA
ncbi:IS4 family transposase [Streptomyces sp. HC307]|uniref:IS4 family transposase n=1 Tax=Streptomyces flavusporus TaxID=3385496 RepID=UPI003916D992